MSALKSTVKHTRYALGSLTAVLFACAVPDRRQACSSTITGAGLLSRAGSPCNEGTSRRIVMLETGCGGSRWSGADPLPRLVEQDSPQCARNRSSTSAT